MNIKGLFCSAVFLVGLTGCGGGGGGGGEAVGGSGEPAGGAGATDATTMEGAVIDGYIVGATVCLDLNNNYACDVTEPSAESGEDGAYSFEVTGDIPPGTQILADIPVGAEDQDLGPITKAYNMLAPHDNSTAVTPLTTLVSQEMLSSGGEITAEQAELAVKLTLGIDSDTDLLGNDFIAEADLDLQGTAEVLAEALAATKAVLEGSEGAATLSAAEITKAAIATVKNVVAAELIVGGKAALTVAEATAAVTQTVQGQVQNIVAATKSGDGEAVSLVDVIKSGELIILSEEEKRIVEGGPYVEGLMMEFVYFPEAEEGKIVDITSGSADKVGFRPYDEGTDRWVSIELGEDYFLGPEGVWSLASENEGAGTKLEKNCATFYDDGITASREYCFIRKDLSGKRIGDVIPDLCSDGDDDSAVTGCDPDLAAPEGSFVYDAVYSAVENGLGGYYELWFDSWCGYVCNDEYEETISGFIEYHQVPFNHSSRGDDCNSPFRVKSYNDDSKTGIFEWTSRQGGCNSDWNWEEDAVVEESVFSVVTIANEEIIKTPTPRLVRANNPGEYGSSLTFGMAKNTQGVIGIFGGRFYSAGTKISLPFNGSVDYTIFASRVLVDFVFGQTGTPEFPYDDFLVVD